MEQQPVTNGHTLTAVEWLQELYDSRPAYEEFIMEDEFEKAKAMEKKQIKKAFEEGGVQYMSNIGDDRPPKAEDYYNKTFNH